MKRRSGVAILSTYRPIVQQLDFFAKAGWTGVDFFSQQRLAPVVSHGPWQPQSHAQPTHTYEAITSENAALVLIDHQVGLMSGVRDYSIAELERNVFGLLLALLLTAHE